MKKGTKLKYIGNGFLGFNKDHLEMTLISVESSNLRKTFVVDYFNGETTFNMAVFDTEVEEVKIPKWAHGKKKTPIN